MSDPGPILRRHPCEKDAYSVPRRVPERDQWRCGQRKGFEEVRGRSHSRGSQLQYVLGDLEPVLDGAVGGQRLTNNEGCG